MSASAVPLARPLGATIGFLHSTIGRKIVMAVTGAILLGFVLVHMLGNLQVYLGPEAMNGYAAFLRSVLHGWGLWLARVVLLASVGLHIWAATTLTLESWRARPAKYRRWQPRESTYASRTMRWGGVIVAAFVVYHLMHFTFGNAHPDFREGDVYHNFVTGFRSLPVSAAYSFANLVLGLHMWHGFWSMLRTLGLEHPRYVRASEVAAALFALIVVAGNLSFPLAVLTGLLE